MNSPRGGYALRSSQSCFQERPSARVCPDWSRRRSWRSTVGRVCFLLAAWFRVLALAVYLFLPETPKFLCLRSARHAELGRLLRRLEPQLQVPADAQYVLSGEATGCILGGAVVHRQARVAHAAAVVRLVRGELVFHSFNTWLPTLMTDTGVPFARAAHLVVLFQFLGTLGGWVIARPLDRLGMVPCTILYVLSIPVIASLGLPGHGDLMVSVLVSMAGFCILGLHFAQVSCVSSVYPTSVRAFGVGWFMLFARAGGAIGPAVVGVLVGQHMSMSTLFYWATLPLALGTVASIAVTVLYKANYHKRADTPAKFAVGQPT